MNRKEMTDIEWIIRQALAEDVGSGDVTSAWTLPPDLRLRGIIRAKASGVLAGLDVARRVFAAVDRHVRFHELASDGQEISQG
ncbi:MAG: nicotinate-nucleotide diphosphorylase (carboxylating), partial [Chloroflexi bacterium]|nr:nicotinate-nucleotide diphosphorylase (carboxylating) [Chloroflexota bacterium]